MNNLKITLARVLTKFCIEGVLGYFSWPSFYERISFMFERETVLYASLIMGAIAILLFCLSEYTKYGIDLDEKIATIFGYGSIPLSEAIQIVYEKLRFSEKLKNSDDRFYHSLLELMEPIYANQIAVYAEMPFSKRKLRISAETIIKNMVRIKKNINDHDYFSNLKTEEGIELNLRNICLNKRGFYKWIKFLNQ